MPTVTIPTSFGAMDAYLAIPKTDGPWPAVLIVHDALGMTTDLRHQADWLAGADFLALAPNLYHWGSRMRCLFTTLKAARRGHRADRVTGRRRVRLLVGGDFGAALVRGGNSPRPSRTPVGPRCELGMLLDAMKGRDFRSLEAAGLATLGRVHQPSM